MTSVSETQMTTEPRRSSRFKFCRICAEPMEDFVEEELSLRGYCSFLCRDGYSSLPIKGKPNKILPPKTTLQARLDLLGITRRKYDEWVRLRFVPLRGSGCHPEANVPSIEDLTRAMEKHEDFLAKSFRLRNSRIATMYIQRQRKA